MPWTEHQVCLYQMRLSYATFDMPERGEIASRIIAQCHAPQHVEESAVPERAHCRNRWQTW